VVPVRIALSSGDDAVMLPMLIDTGADETLVPVAIVRQLGLPPIDVVAVIGIHGGRRRGVMHAADLSIGDFRIAARVVAFSHEAILGRNVLNQLVMILDGPASMISVRRPARPRRRAGR
jgi:predicted aspartyl protease